MLNYLEELIYKINAEGRPGKRRSEKIYEPRTAKARKFLEQFSQGLYARNIGKRTIELYFSTLNAIFYDIGKPIEDITESDLLSYARVLNDRYMPKTTDFRVGLIKNFFKEIGREKLTGKLKFHKKKDIKKIPKDLITRQELKAMLRACHNQRDRALIYFLYESAGRKGEVAAMNIGDLEFDEYGAKAYLNGKTGERVLRICESVPDLKFWINVHPRNEGKDSPLWVSISHNGFGQRMVSGSIQFLVDLVARRAGIKRKIFPHLFRHSRLTELASIMSEFQLKKFAGWEMSSDMAQIYVNRTGVDAESPILAQNGIETAHKKPEVEKIECPNCGSRQSIAAKFCYECGQGLNNEDIVKFGKRKRWVVLGKVIERLAEECPEAVNIEKLEEYVGRN